MAQAERVSIASRAPITAADGGPVRAAYESTSIGIGRGGYPANLARNSAIDLEQRADHLNEVLSGLAGYLTVVLDDTAQNTPGGLELCDAEAILADLASDLTGAILNAADEMAGRVA